MRDAAGRQGDSANPFYVTSAWFPEDKRGWHCEKVSAGCAHCFSERLNVTQRRDMGTGLPFNSARRDQLMFHLDEEMLRRWTIARVPRPVFVNSMTDWAGEWWPDEFRDKMFAAMACSPHTFYLLTKRPAIARNYLRYAAVNVSAGIARLRARIPKRERDKLPSALLVHPRGYNLWPLPNVRLGVSVEDQKTADERIPILLDTPAAHRFVSYEPALEYADVHPYFGPGKVEWLIYGVESGPNARLFRLNNGIAAHEADGRWVTHRIIADTREAGIPLFIKQISLNGRVSHDPAEWPEDIRVRAVPC